MTTEQRPIILIVEDEFLIRMFAVSVVEEAGFSWLEAATPAEARVHLGGENQIAVLFTDIEMGDPVDGIALAHETYAAQPHIRLLVTSGRVCPGDNVLPPKSIFLPKPYESHGVVAALRELLAA
jgi:CheY-like chemotaxis protein